jgi:hypothetical protein
MNQFLLASLKFTKIQVVYILLSRDTIHVSYADTVELYFSNKLSKKLMMKIYYTTVLTSVYVGVKHGC